ncbi:hypothetical protein F8388_004321 [Cannabis sativa]|uniref:Reverse transcriptase zinc-binding domain-containing protein n=1 Tax=Cannabis sativa TaxID=3483 RepID=A0A7J6H9S1_CANSA|nr:hypothetical protein F8388_004321 [Cannabis sativa]
MVGILNRDNEWCSKVEDMTKIITGFYGQLFTTRTPSLPKIEELLQMINYTKSVLLFSPNTSEGIREVGDLMMVSELIEQPGQWNKDLIHQVFSTPDSQLILSIPITLFEHDDDWLWHFTSHGHYSVKSGYNLAIGGEILQPSSSNEVMAAWCSSYWAIEISKKKLHFGWKGFHEILPSFSGLLRRHSSPHSNCPICGFGNDTNAHAIFWCSFSQGIWKQMSFFFLASPKEDLTFKGILLYASKILEKEDFEKVLISAWTIWFERNKKSHGRTIRTPHQIKIWISSYYNEIYRERNKTKKEVSTGCTSEQSNAETEVLSYKLYVDAATSTPQNVIGFGAVIFSSDKQIKAALSKPLHVYVSNLLMKLLESLSAQDSHELRNKTIKVNSPNERCQICLNE